MLAPLDIFKMQDGTYVWKAEADTFELAKSIAEELGPGTPSCLGDQMHFENAFSRCADRSTSEALGVCTTRSDRGMAP